MSFDAIESKVDRIARMEGIIFLCGFATFALLYWAQPILPLLAQEFDLSPAHASLISASSSFLLALGLVPASLISDHFGRKPVLCTSLCTAALLTLIMGCKLTVTQLMLARLLLGLAISGIPAIGMTYLSEEVPAPKLGKAMGLYVAGNALGGMSTRLLMSYGSTYIDWHFLLRGLGTLSLLLSVVVVRYLPKSEHFEPQAWPKTPTDRALLLNRWRQTLARLDLWLLYTLAFMLMGIFVSVYNYLEFRLLRPPFLLSLQASGAVFLSYLIGMFSSGFIGRCSDHFGRPRTLKWMNWLVLMGLILTLSARIEGIILGVLLLTFGFFGAHATASTWVNINAGPHKAYASALYLFFYYLGSSLVGSIAGVFWQQGGWPLLTGFLAALLLMAQAGVYYLSHLEERGHAT